MITRKTKIGVISAGIFATTAVTTVTAINMARADESDKIFVQLDGQTFTSRNALTEYVKSMADVQTFNTGETAFSINVGQNSLMFTNATQASRYVEEYFTTNFTAYLKPDHERYIDPLTGIISAEGYYKASDIFFNTYKTNNGGYTFALKGDIVANEKAKQEAAESYITMHNAYRWNGIYFNNEVSLERYLRSEIDSVDRVDQEAIPGFTNEAGVSKTFDFSDPAQSAEFDRWSASTSYPTVEYAENQFERLTPDNVDNIANLTSDEIYSFIPIISNNDEVTKIVDISNSTETGSLYGAYTTTSGANVSSVGISSNWNKTTEETEGFTGYSAEIEKISALISVMFEEYLLHSNGENVLEGFVTEYKPFGKNLFEIIDPIAEQTRNFISEIGDGQRGTLFNTVHVLYSYVINQLIQTGGSRTMVDEFTKYMIEIADYMDGKAMASILPFINGIDGENHKINFFKEIYSFGEKGFQNNILSFWRAIDDDKEHGLSTIRDLLIIVFDIASLASTTIMKNDDLIVEHIDWYGKLHTDELLDNWDRRFAEELKEIKYRNLSNNIGIGDLTPVEIYENIDFVVGEIYSDAIDKYFFDLEQSIIDDPTLIFFDIGETTSEFYLGFSIINDEEWQGEDISILENKVPTDAEIKRERWDNKAKLAEALGGAVQYLAQDKIWTTEWWYESFTQVNLGEITGLVFALADVGMAIAMLVLTKATLGIAPMVYAIAKTVINTLVSLLPEATFSGSRTNVYSYYDDASNNKWYWDGGNESWSWFGMFGQTDSIGLESLEIIVTDNIIDGYSLNGYYYNGNRYSSSEGAKRQELLDTLYDVNDEVYVEDDYAVERELITWVTIFKGHNPIYKKTLEEMHNYLKTSDNLFNYTDDLYNIDGNLTNEHDEIIDSEIERWLTTIDPILIIQNPTLLPNGEYLKAEFDLPKPRFTDDGFEAYEGSNPNYEVVDTNINVDLLQEGLIDGTYTQEFVDTMLSLVNMTEGEIIDNLFSVYASFINPQTKLVLFDVMNDQGSNMAFDELNENTEMINLVEAKFKDGSIHTFLGKSNAVDSLLANDNYDYNIVDIARNYNQYMFNEYAGSTIDSLVEEIILRNEFKGGKYAQL